MSSNAGLVIAGAGQAGFQVALTLRTEGYEGPITLIGDEPWLPYQRPPLSKGFLTGKQAIEAISLRPENYYADHHIDLLMGERITAIDRAKRSVWLASGGEVPYDTLVLATGARNRLLPVKGADLDGVCYLRTRDEAVDVVRRMETAENVVVIGGGFIGLELAAAANTLGKQVMVVEAQPRLMSRAVAPIMSEFFRELHLNHGVAFALGASALEIAGRGSRVSEAVLSNGAVHPADLVVVGIGVVPNTELAEAAGLAVGNGIVVDEQLRTQDEHIYAIGDCALYPNRFAGGVARLESVQNAVDQAKCVAAAIMGRPRIYDAVPWFWTDHFDAKMQMVGISHGCDVVVTRGLPETRKFSVCYFKDNQLVAIDSVNRPADHMAGRKLLTAGTSLTPEQAGDDRPLSQVS